MFLSYMIYCVHTRTYTCIHIARWLNQDSSERKCTSSLKFQAIQCESNTDRRVGRGLEGTQMSVSHICVKMQLHKTSLSSSLVNVTHLFRFWYCFLLTLLTFYKFTYSLIEVHIFVLGSPQLITHHLFDHFWIKFNKRNVNWLFCSWHLLM